MRNQNARKELLVSEENIAEVFEISPVAAAYLIHDNAMILAAEAGHVDTVLNANVTKAFRAYNEAKKARELKRSAYLNGVV